MPLLRAGLLLTSWAVVCGVSAVNHSLSQFDVVVAFGDSWTDNGNGSWILTNHTIPGDPAFWNGRYSNGPSWVEGLTDLLGAKQLLDFAHGGATINNSLAAGRPSPSATINSPSVTDQVAAFLGSAAVVAEPARALCVLVAGTNDAYFGGPGLSVRALTDSLVRNVELLVAEGFRNFLIPSSSFLDLEPIWLMDSTIPNLHTFSPAFGTAVRASLRASHLPKHVKVKLWDIRADLVHIMDEAMELGWVTDKPCLSGAWGEAPARTLCDDPDRYIFFDISHPTKVAHRALAESAAALFELTSVIHEEL